MNTFLCGGRGRDVRGHVLRPLIWMVFCNRGVFYRVLTARPGGGNGAPHGLIIAMALLAPIDMFIILRAYE